MAFPPAGSGTRTSCAEDLPEEGPRQIASAQAAGESAKRIQRSYRAGLLHHPEVYDDAMGRRLRALDAMGQRLRLRDAMGEAPMAEPLDSGASEILANRYLVKRY